MVCRICHSNQIKRDGGNLGLCWQHRKRRCQICGNPSGGKQQCVVCEHKEDIARWKHESNPLYSDPDHKRLEIQLRQERLNEAKFHMHRAVEVMFRSWVLTMEAMWTESDAKLDEAENFGPPQIEEDEVKKIA